MTTSPLKFELIDGAESATQERHARPRDLFKANVKQQNSTERSQKSQTLRASMMPAVLDPSLLHDLAEGLEFLNRQLDDAESELTRSRQQALIFEQDARRWEDESARFRNEAEETRQAVDKLRKELEEARAAAGHQRDEMAEVRASNAHLEKLAGEQQRALVLSLELLKRLNEGLPPQPAGESEATAALLNAKDQEIANLKRLVVAAGEEGTRVDDELARVRADHQSAQTQIDTLQSELAAAAAELVVSRTELEATRSEFAKLREQLEQLDRLEVQPHPDADLPLQLAELKAERVRTGQKLQDAEAEIALQNAEIESRGAIIIALENALEEQNASLRTLEERFLAYAEQVQTIQLQRLETPQPPARSISSTFAKIFSPPKRERKD